MLREVLGSVEHLSPVGFGVRAVLVGIMLWFLSRFLPRRSGGQFAGYDFAFFWMMGGLLASPLYDSRISFINTITAIVTIYSWHYAISYIVVKSHRWARVIVGEPVTLMRGGKAIRQNMRRALFPLEMLLSELRTYDAPNPAEVDAAVLETSGHVSVLKKPEYQPVTPKDLQIPTLEAHLPALLVNDGHVMTDELHKRGYDERWLESELLKLGARQFRDVYVATLDAGGRLSCSLRNPGK